MKFAFVYLNQIYSLIVYFLLNTDSNWCYVVGVFWTSKVDSRQLVLHSSSQKHIVWKLPKMSHLNFCNPIKVDMSGNTDWPQASGFQKTRQIAQFLAFLTNFCPLTM